MQNRIGSCKRKTKETDIELTINLDGQGKNQIDTGIPFFDHMLDGFARHGLFDLNVKVRGDLEVDSHHTIEDTGIVLTTGKTDESTAEITSYSDYAAYNSIQAFPLSDNEYEDVLSDFVPPLPPEEEEETVTNLKI